MDTIQRNINIMVRLQGVAAARQGLQQVNASARQVNAGLAGGSVGANNLGRSLSAMGAKVMQTGSNMQWLGRQLQFSFSLPIMAAGVAAGKWALDSEKAMTRVKKVYGDMDLADAIGADGVERELEALGNAFTALSNKFGVLREDVINIAGEWAAAGSSGIALANATRETLRAMILGEMEAEEATKALISMQAQYKLSTADLADTLNKFNIVENETTTKMSDLVIGFEKSASVARQYGVSVNELAAMLTALIPATGGAAAAGNGLKTMMSRLMAPTAESMEMFSKLGININDASWASANAAGRFGIVAKAFENVSPAARSAAASILLSNWQVNRGSELIANINDPMSQYHKTLELLSGNIDIAKVAQDELNAVLDSSPKKLEIMWNIMRNAMADVIQPLIPILLMLAGSLARALQAFQDMGPVGRAAVGALLVFLAVLGPLVLYLAALQQAFGAVLFLFGRLAGAVLAPVVAIGKLLALPFGGLASGTSVAADATIKTLGKLGSWTAVFFKNYGSLFVGLGRIIVATVGPALVQMRTAWGAHWATMSASLGAYWMRVQAQSAAGSGRLAAIFTALRITMLGSQSSIIRGMGMQWTAMNAGWAAYWVRVQAQSAMGAGRIASIFGGLRLTLLGSQSAFLVGLGMRWTAFNAEWVKTTAITGSRILGLWVTTLNTLIVRQTGALGIIGKTLKTTTLAMFFMTSATNRALLLEAIKTSVLMAKSWAAAGIASAFSKVMLAMRILSSATALSLIANHVKTMLLMSAATIRSGVAAAFSKIMFAMRILSSATAMSLIANHIKTMVAMRLATIGSGIVKAFQAVMTGMIMVSMFAWSNILKIARTGMVAKILTISKTGLLAVWGVLMKGMVAIASSGWRLIVLVARRGVTGLLGLLKSAGVAIISFLISPWGIAVLAITGILYMFRDQIATVFSRIKAWFSNIGGGAAEGVANTAGIFGKFVGFLKKAFWGLPVEVQNAMMAVVRVISNAAKQVYQWLSYLNPFARHSPSLVENVSNGMSAIGDSFSALPGAIAGPISSAYSHIESLKDLTASMAGIQLEMKYADQIKALNIHVPQAVGSFRALMNILPGMQQQLRGLEKSVKAQESVVKAWQIQLDAATKAVETQEKAIAKLQAQADEYSKVIDAAQSRISDLSSAPLTGMRAMEDQMQANTLAQNKLRLEMLKAEKAGGAYKSIEDRLSAINGELETAQSKRLELQMGGAGSEILSFYDDQIAALHASKDATKNAQDPVDEMSAAMAALEHEAEILNLEKAINFDPLVYEIEKLADAEKELSFDQITSGITAAQAEVARYQPMLDGVNQKISEQERVLSGLEAQKQAIQDQYDIEDEKLQQVKASYDELAQSIQDVESALDGIGSIGSDMEQRAESARSAAEGAKDKLGKDKDGKLPKEGELSRVDKLWQSAEGGTFDIPGGTGFVGREGMGEQTADIDEMTRLMTEETAGMLGEMDIFGPIKKQWNNLSKWLQEHIQPAFGPIASGAKTLFSGINMDSIMGPDSGIGGFFAFIEEKWNLLKPHLITAGGMIKRLFGDDFKDLFLQAKEAALEFWENLQPAFEALGKALPGIAMTLGAVIGVIVVLVKLVLNLLINILRPVFAFIGDLISAILEIFSGVFVILEGIFTLDLGKILEGLGMIAGAIWKVIKSLFTNIVAIVLGIFGAIIDTVIGVFNAIFGTAIQDIGYYIDAIVDWFKALPGLIWSAISWLGGVIADFFVGIWNAIADFFVMVGSAVGSFFVNLFTSVIDWFKKLPGMIGDAIMWLWNVIVDFFVGIYNEIVGNSIIPDLVNDVAMWFWKLPGMIWDAIVALGTQIWNGLVNISTDFINFAASVIAAWNGFWSGVKEKAEEILMSVISWIVGRLHSLKASWETFQEDVKTVWNKFWGDIKSKGEEILKSIVDWIVIRLSILKTGWETFQDDIKTGWDNFWNRIKKVGTDFMDLIRSGIDTGLTAIRGFFDNAVTFIGNRWDNLKSLVSTPVRFVIDTVINKGIIGGWNGVLDLLQLPDKGLSKRLGIVDVKGFKSGGVLPGSATGPGDNMAVVDKYGNMQATIRSGEGIVREPAMRRLMRSDPTAFDYINRYGAIPDSGAPAFFMGGTMPTPGPVRRHPHPYWTSRYAADMGLGTGSPIYAWKAGQVAIIRRRNVSYGNETIINHPGGEQSQYAHQSAINVAVGQAVAAGQKIGAIGYSGNVRPPGPGGAHLHFEIRGGNSPLGSMGSGVADSDTGGIFSKALDWISDKITKPVRAFINNVPAAGVISDTVKAMSGNLLDRAIEKIKELIPGGDSSSDVGAPFVPGSAGSVPGLGGVTANTYAKAANIYAAARAAGHKISTVGGYRGDGEHVTRRALDFMVSSKPAGDFISSYAWGNRDKLGLQHVIWWQRIISSGRAGEGWRRMADRGSYTQNHMDHPHILFNASDKALAKGTNGARSGWHLVGEAGAELVNFGGGEKVLNNQKTLSLISSQINDTTNALKQMVATASVLALVNAATGREATVAVRSIAAVGAASQRSDRRGWGGRNGSVQRTDESSGGVHINKAEFIFPNVKNGNDAEAFMRNLEEYLRRKGS